VLVDYAHNAAAVAGLMDFVQHVEARRRIGVIAVPGDRRDDDVRAVGRLAAGLDRVIVKEDDDPRGRQRGEIAELLIAGLVEGGLPRDRVEVVHEELAAVDRLLAELDDGDLGIVLADDVRAVLDRLRQGRA
jgi:cyanophycin synthetase